MPKYHSGGRSKASEWNEFTIVDENPTRVYCNHCKETVIKKIERVKAHLKKCSKRKEFSEASSSRSSTLSMCVNDSDDNVSEISEINKVSSEDLADLSSSTNICEFVSSTPMKKIKKQTNISSFVVRTTPEEKEQLDLKIAKFFFSANVPFSVTENHEFKEMIKALRPGYEPPNRKLLGSTLLSKVNDEATKSLKVDLKTKSVTLLQDGWSSVTNDPIIAHSIHDGKQPHLLFVTDAGSHKKTAEYCAELAKGAINIAKEKYNIDVSKISK